MALTAMLLASCGGGGGGTADGGGASAQVSVSLVGNGRVTAANPAGGTVTCPSTCSAPLPLDTQVELTAVPDAGNVFAGWGGACSASAGTVCRFTVTQDATVVANFAVVQNGAPTVASTTPANGATGQALDSVVDVTFSEAMNCATLTTSSFTLTGPGGTAVGGSVSCPTATTARFTPTVALATSTTYTARLAATIADVGGATLAAPQAWSFGTVTPATGSSFTFLAYGDSRAGNGCTGNTAHISLVNRMVGEPASFVFHLGDMVTGYDSSTNWVQRGGCPNEASKGSFKEIIAPLQSKTPAAGLPTFYFPVVGNHDDSWGDGWYPDAFGNGFCDVFRPNLFVPNHTTKSYFADKSASFRIADATFYSLACSTTNRTVYPSYMYYSFDHENTHFVVMRVNNDNHLLDECNNCTNPNSYDDYYYKHQLDWLRADLAVAAGRADIQNVVVLLHAPIFTASWGHAANASWPVLSKEISKNGKVKLVLQGHNHVYERTYPIFASDAAPSGVRDDQKGTVYITTGGGGSDFHGFSRVSPLNAVQDTLYHYLRIDVDGSRITVKAFQPDGTLFDSVTR